MARPSKEGINATPGGDTDVQSNPQAAQVNATPVAPLVQASENTGLYHLVHGLSALQPGLNAYLDTRQQENVASEQEQGRLAAQQGQYSTYDEGFKALSSASSPWFQRAYMQQVGQSAAQDYQRQLSEHLAQNIDPNDPDPAKAKQVIGEFFRSQTAGLKDAHYLSGFEPTAAQANSQALASVEQAHISRVRLNALDQVAKGVDGALANPNRSPNWLDDAKDQARALNIPVKEAEMNAFSQARLQAVLTGNVPMLETFAKPTRDGQSSFAVREPSDYWAAVAAARTQADKLAKQGHQQVEFSVRNELNTDLENAKSFKTPIPWDKWHLTLKNMVDTETMTGAEAAGIYKEALDADRKYRKAISNSDAYLDGSAFTMGLTHEEMKQSAQVAASRIVEKIQGDKSIPDEQKASLVMAEVARVSLANRTIYPDHLALMQVAAADQPAQDAKGSIAMPARFKDASTIAFNYWSKDPQVFRSAFKDDKESAEFYDRYFTNLQRDPNKDPEAAYRATRLDIHGQPGSTTKVEVPHDTLNTIVKNSVDNIRSKIGRSWFDALNPFSSVKQAPSFDTDVYARSEVQKYVLDAYQRNPGANAKSVEDQATKAFASQHVLVNGQWLNTSSMPAGMSKEQAADLTEGLNAYKTIVTRDSGMAAYLGTADSKDAVITLSPRPTSVTVERGPLHTVFINGIPTDRQINPEQLTAQWKNGKFVDPERIQSARTLTDQISHFAASPETLTEPQYKATVEALEFNRVNGFMSSSNVSAAKDQLDAAHDAARVKVNLLDAQKKDAAIRSSDSLAQSVTDTLRRFDGEDFANIKGYGKFTPDPANAFTFIKNAAAKGETGAALMGAVAGYNQTRYEQNGDTKVGFGYSLTQPEDTIKEDLRMARVVPSMADSGRMLQLIREGKYKLNEFEARQLFNAQATRVSKDIKTEIGEKAWKTLPTPTQHALAVLYLNAKPGRFGEMADALRAGDWGSVGDELNVDPSHRKAATSFVRLLMSGQQQFSKTITNNF